MKRLTTTSVLVFGLVTSLALVTSCSDGLYEDDLDYNTSLASDAAIEGGEAVHITINQVGNDQIDNQRVVEKSDDSIFSLLVADEHPVEISLENPLEKVKTIQMDICDEDDFLTLKRCETTDRTAGFLCRASESSNGCCSFLLFSLSVSGAIDQGTGPIVVLKYGASEDAPAGACRSLTTENVAATDVVNNPLEVISSQGEFCFAGDVFPCDDVIIDPDDEEVSPGTTIDFTASSASGNDNCVPACYEWRIASTIGSTISSEGSYRAGSPGGVDEIMLLDACVDEPGDRLLATAGLLATAEVRVVVGDLDEDDIPDDVDKCPDSDLFATVLIGACDSGVVNAEFSDGCWMNDLIGECAADEEENHGSLVSCVAHLTNAWKKDGEITGREKGAIQSCAALSDVP